jgi:hypothetical protein
VGGVGAGEHSGPDLEQLARPAVMDVGRVNSAIPLWRRSALYQAKKAA